MGPKSKRKYSKTKKNSDKARSKAKEEARAHDGDSSEIDSDEWDDLGASLFEEGDENIDETVNSNDNDEDVENENAEEETEDQNQDEDVEDVNPKRRKSNRVTAISPSKKKQQFSCHICLEVFEDRKIWEDHYKQVHDYVPAYECSKTTCGLTYFSELQLKTHQESEHPEFRRKKTVKSKFINCTTCNEDFQSHEEFDVHKCLRKITKIKVEPEEGYDDDEDFEEEEDKEDMAFQLEQPKRIRGPYRKKKRKGKEPVESSPKKEKGPNTLNYTEFEYSCSICKRKFQRMESRDQHYNKHLSNLKCSSCPKVLTSLDELSEHMESCIFFLQTQYSRLATPSENAEDPTRPFICIHPECTKGFPDRNQLRRHMNGVHALERPFPCSICSMSFKRREDLKKHETGTHEGKRRKIKLPKSEEPQVYICETCGRQLSDSQGLRRHILGVHAKSRDYTCELCPAAFKRKSDLTSHTKRTHENSRPFECPSCDKNFATKKELQLHTYVHSGEPRKFLCEFCGQGYDYERRYNQHLKIKHLKVRPFECEYCSKRFSYKNGYKMHLTRCVSALSIFPELRTFLPEHIPDAFEEAEKALASKSDILNVNLNEIRNNGDSTTTTTAVLPLPLLGNTSNGNQQQQQSLMNLQMIANPPHPQQQSSSSIQQVMQLQQQQQQQQQAQQPSTHPSYNDEYSLQTIAQNYLNFDV